MRLINFSKQPLCNLVLKNTLPHSQAIPPSVLDTIRDQKMAGGKD